MRSLGPPISALVLSSFSIDASALPSDSLSRLVLVARVSSATSRFLSDRNFASSGALSLRFLSGTSTIVMFGGGCFGGGGGFFCWGGGGGGGGGAIFGGGGSASATSGGF